MRRTRQLLLATLLGASFGAPTQAQQGPLDAQSIRPAVMLLIDTSGSMERIPDDGTNPSCDDCVPRCTGNTLIDRNNKTRWALTVEALTGSISEYQCVTEDRSSYARTEYDYGYYLPHINFTRNLAQSTDGILDSFASRVKFGLMTFDGVGTTLGGETLVPYHTWFDDDGFRTAANGSAGMYSYGDVGRLAFPGCVTDYGINAGARGPGNFPGALLSVARTENSDDVLAVNTQIQQSLLQVRPFGGTPIPAMLEDLRYYLRNSADINSTGDQYYACRQRKAILITDGAPDAMFRDTRFNCDVAEKLGSQPTSCQSPFAPNSHPNASFPNSGCSCPYQTPEAIAAGLKSENLVSDLIVVAYNVHDTNALIRLNAIGEAAGFVDPTSTDPTLTHLVQADGAGELRQKLDQLLNALQPGVTSRSVPVSVNVGDPALDGNSKRFDITAGFQVGRNTAETWQGLLYRGRAVCIGTTVSDEPFSASAGDVFHETLTQQAGSNRRALLTVTPQTYGPVNGSLRNANFSPARVQPTDAYYDPSRLPTTWVTANVVRPDGSSFSTSDRNIVDSTTTSSQGAITENLNVPSVSSPNFVDTSALNPLYFGDATHDDVPGTVQDRAAVVNYAYGRGRPNALADIYHSQPVVMLPINRASEARVASINARYTNWLRTLMSTASGAHYDTSGRPGVVFVGTNDGVLHAFNLDTWTDHGSTVPAGHELWGFVPPALFGKMASMLDSHQVGFDASPEVKDVVLQRRPNGEPIFRTVLVSALSGAPAYIALDVTFPEAPVFLWQASFPDVGNTIGNVALTQVNVNWRSQEEQVRAVAILPGGEGVACSGSVSPVANKTRAEFPSGNTRDVRCWNRRGRALYVVDVATGQLLQEFGPEHFPSPLTGSVAVDGLGVSTSSAAYFFDHDGILWRLSMLSSDPHNWKVAPIFDMFHDPVVSSVTPSWQAGRRPQYAPALVRDKTGNLVILAATGDPDSPRDTARQRVVSLLERRGALRNGEIAAEVVENWRIDLDANEGVTGPLTVFQDVVYFGTFTSGAASSLCTLGTSRLWGVHAYLSVDPSASPRSPVPKLARRNAAPTDPLVAFEEYNNNSLVLGVTVKQQPICQSASRYFNATTQQSVPTAAAGGGAFMLSGVMAGGSTGGQTRGGDTSRGAIVETAPQTLRVQNQSKVTSWASAFE